MLPRGFFVTSGKAYTPISELNAFDKALKDAGIAHCNIVQVSSILPENCTRVEKAEIPFGAITHAVLAKMNGSEGQNIGAAIAWGRRKGGSCGIIAETHGYMDRDALLEVAEWKIKEMAKIREMELEDINHVYENLRVPLGNYGCVVAALVFLPEY